MSEVLEGSLIKVPYETLKRTTRARKYVLDDISRTLTAFSSVSCDIDAPVRLKKLAAELQGLKDKAGLLGGEREAWGLEAVGESEADDLARLRARTAHLAALGSPAPSHSIPWSRPRVNRLIADHMLRAGYRESASRLMLTSDPRLADAHIFEPVQGIISALQRRSCAEALAWCRENEARLSKSRSSLVFRLRKQEFVELVRGGDMVGAIAYARRHLAPWAPTQMPEIQAAAATLAFRAGAVCPQYAPLLADEQWQELVEAFKQEVYRLYSLPPTSLLTIHLQAGLAALNTPLPGPRSRVDPLHLQAYASLASGLPRAKHSHSQLLCALSHEPLDEHNPPLVMPNGYVYGEAALKAQAEANDGYVTCIATGYRCKLSKLKRAFIS